MKGLARSFFVALIWVGLLKAAFPGHTWLQFWAAMGIYLTGYINGSIKENR
jgi:hypothetical protein